MKLLPSQKNILFEIVEYYELPPSQFVFQESKGQMTNDICTNLEFSNSEYYFSFESYPGNEPHYCIYSPGDVTFTTETYSRSWEGTMMEFHNWLSFLKREITTVNKWDRLKLEMDNLKLSFNENDNNKFSVAEYSELKEKIILLREGIAKIELPTDQMRILNDKLDHLTNLAEEMNKYDWKNLFVGTMMSVIIQLSVTPENAKNLFALLRQIFSTYLLP